MSHAHPNDIVFHPYVTEKALDLLDRENKIIFVVDRRANKTQIKWAVEKLFDAKVVSVNTRITPKGQKQAIVGFPEGVSATEIGQRIGVF